MESETRSKIIVKTPQQLQNQTFQINLNNALRGSMQTNTLPGGFLEDPAGFRKDLAEYRKRIPISESGVRMIPRPDRQNLNYERYESYLTALRQYRKAQKESGETALLKNRDDSYAENYLRMKQFDRGLAYNVLKRLQEVSGQEGMSPKILTDKEVEIGTLSREELAKASERIIQKKPDVFYSRFDILKHILPPDKIKSHILAQGPKDGFLLHFSECRGLFSIDEQKSLIQPLMLRPESAEAILSLFKNPQARVLFEPDEVSKSVVLALKSVDKFEVGYMVNRYFADAVVSGADLEEIILDRIANFKNLTGLPDAQQLLGWPVEERPEEWRKAIVDAYSQKAIGETLPVLEQFMSWITPQDKQQIFESVFQRDPQGCLKYLYLPEAYLRPENSKGIIARLLATPDLKYDAESVKAVIGSFSITDEEREVFVDNLINEGHAQWIFDKFESNISRIPEEKQKELTKKILTNTPIREVVLFVDRWRKFADPELVNKIVEAAKRNPRAVQTMFSMDHYWKQIIGVDGLLALQNEFQGIIPEYFLSNLEHHKLFPEGGEQKYIIPLIEANPPVALFILADQPDYFAKQGLPFSQEEIITGALIDWRYSFAPKLLTETYGRISTKPIQEQKTLAIDLFNIYKAIAYIKQAGLEDQFRGIQATGVATPRAERDLLTTFHCYGLLKITNPEQFRQIGDLGATVEDAKKTLLNQIPLLLGSDRTITSDEASRFFGAMENPVPFMLYSLQYQDSEPHRKVLSEIFGAIANNKFPEWKYGEPTQERFEQLKAEGLLPRKLTFEQYTIWRTDEQTTLFESLATDTQEVAATVKGYLEDNLNHLQITEVIDDVQRTYPDAELSDGLQLRMAGLGQELATVNRELTALRRAGNVSARVSELESKKTKLDEERTKLVRARKIFRLMDLKPNEIASGYLLQGKGANQRGESIAKIIGDLKQESLVDSGFVYEHIETLINALNEQTGEKQNLVCTDSSDPKTWMEIGEVPVASCQSYNQGSMNECLIGYTDPGTKILVLRNERGAIIGRSIFRLMETKNGDPRLHVETIYKNTTSKGVDRSIYMRGLQKAERMKVSVDISERSQNELGEEVVSDIPAGFIIEDVDYSLFSRASRAPFVYVDALGGSQTNGLFELKNLREIKVAA